ncbi:hypothetical protein ACFYY2_07315 [Streptomyces sp. NPDC001822]|uniref:hypothetical protein n=1 Tax=Streptomyces sp. NPDC001822 TaxID=3364614 RepID=UPI0036CFA93D
MSEWRNRRPVGDHEAVGDTSIERLLALPRKGTSGRKTAIGAYTSLLAACISASAYAVVHEEPADQAGAAVTQADSMAYTAEKHSGYMPTYLDGSGGIAGVPLTDEQRVALVREAQRRGLSVRDSYALAYGDQARIMIRPDGHVAVDTKGVVVPNGPVYAQVPPAQKVPAKIGTGELESIFAAEGPVQGPAAPLKPGAQAPDSKPHKGAGKAAPKDPKGPKAPKESKEPDYYENSGENPYEDGGSIKDALPPIVGDVVDLLPGFRTWLGQVAGDEAAVNTEIVRNGEMVTITVSATISSGITVTTVIEAPADPHQQSEGIVVTTVVSDAQTGQEITRSDSTEVHDTDSATGVAIGQAVDAVIDAVQHDADPTNDDASRPDLPADVPTPPGWLTPVGPLAPPFSTVPPQDAHGTPAQAPETPAETEAPPALPEETTAPSEPLTLPEEGPDAPLLLPAPTGA